MTLVLASASPQRREILAALGFAFEVVPSDAEEAVGGVPAVVAGQNALKKAFAVAHGRPAGDLVLGVDTVVAVDGEPWGKPADAAEAAAMIARLAGRTHEVVSGYALVGGGPTRSGSEITAVTFRELDRATIDWYVATEEWRGRAGGYAIQGRGGALIGRIEGDYLNVVGLPVSALAELWPLLVGE